MRIDAIAIALCLAALATRTPAFAQDNATPHVGSRVRVTAPGQLGHRVVGSLSAIDSVLLTIDASSGERIGVRREAIQKVEVSMRRGRRWRGALIGAVAGIGVSGILAAGTGPNEFFSPGAVFAIGTILFVPLGAGFGALMAPGERWAAVPNQALGAAEPAQWQGRRLGVAVHF